MKTLYLYIIIATIFGCGNGNVKVGEKKTEDVIAKLEMHLSAFGVESDDYPSIDVFLDFAKDTSFCKRSFYNPAYKGSVYTLSKTEMDSVLLLLRTTDFHKLKKEYTTNSSDQPSSKTIIYTGKQKIIINDYGLVGDYPLQKLYKMVYKL